MLTPNRKRAGKALARRSSMTLANECLSNIKTREYTISGIGRIVRTEIKKMSTIQSILCSQSDEDLRSFKWDDIYTELKQKAPFFLSISYKNKNYTKQSNSYNVYMCCNTFKVSIQALLQKIISLILYSGHCSKKVCF